MPKNKEIKISKQRYLKRMRELQAVGKANVESRERNPLKRLLLTLVMRIRKSNTRRRMMARGTKYSPSFSSNHSATSLE